MTCHGWNCKATKLINAHIMPRGFARDLLGSNTHNFHVTLDRARPTQHGSYDPNILCADCDGKLGVFDDYAISMSRRFNADHIRQEGFFRLPDVDGDKLAKFALAVLWRASISSRPEVRDVRLGPYEALAQEVLFGQRDLADMPAYELIVSRYDEPRTEELLSYPTTVTGLAVHGWGFVLNGFRFVAKMDARGWPGVEAGELAASVVWGQRDLFGRFLRFSSTLEYSKLLAMGAADRKRTQRKE